MAQKLGRNVAIEVKGDVMTITVNLKAPGTPSASGKTDVIATTSGNQAVDGTSVKIGLNVYTPRR